MDARGIDCGEFDELWAKKKTALAKRGVSIQQLATFRDSGLVPMLGEIIEASWPKQSRIELCIEDAEEELFEDELDSSMQVRSLDELQRLPAYEAFSDPQESSAFEALGLKRWGKG